MRSARGCWTEKFVNFAITTIVLGRHVVFPHGSSCVRETGSPTKTEPGSVLGLESEL